MGFGILTAWPYWSEPTHLPPSPIVLTAKLSLTAEKYSTSSKKSWLMRRSVVYILKTSEEHVQKPKSMVGTAMMSLVSTPYEPSKDFPGSPGRGWVNFLA